MANELDFEADKKRPTQQQIIQANRTPKAMMEIRFSYSVRILVPYDKGVAIMKNMEGAEEFDWGEKQITPLKSDSLEFKSFPHVKYQTYKLAQIMGIDPEDVHLD